MATKRYPQELKDRAVRMVLDHEGDYPSRYAAIKAIAGKLDIGVESVRLWVRDATIAATPAGVESAEVRELKRQNRDLEKKNRELVRANEILKAAASFFARELDPPQR